MLLEVVKNTLASSILKIQVTNLHAGVSNESLKSSCILKNMILFNNQFFF